MKGSVLILLLTGFIFSGCHSKQDSISDDSSSWTKCYSMEENNRLECLAYNKNSGTLFAGTSKGVMVSTDYGLTWEYRNNGLHWNKYACAISVVGNRVLFSDLDGTYYSDNDGIQWNICKNGMSNIHEFQYNPTNHRIYASSDFSGLYYSDDNALTWEECPGIKCCPILGMVIKDNLIILENWIPEYVPPSTMIMHSTLKRSIDYGNTFTLVDSICLSDIVSFDSVMFGTSPYHYLYKSSDNGLTWQSDSTLAIKDFYHIYSINPCYIFLGGLTDTIYFSRNQGKEWINISDNFQGRSWYFLQVEDYIYVATMQALWRRNWTKL
jgi:hypothetical protein